MQFSTKQTVKLSQNDLFARLSDFRLFESLAAEKGVRFHRISGDLSCPQNGMSWNVEFHLGGKLRSVISRLDEMDAPDVISYAFESPNIHGSMAFELSPLSQDQTTLTATLDFSAQSLAARLMLQSVKLARTKANKKFEGGVQRFIGLIAET